MRLLITSFLIFILSIYVYAQNTATVTGTVKDKESEFGLPGANIYIIGTNKGARTSSDGSYIIKNVEPGTYKIRASFIGYKSDTLEITLMAGEEDQANFELGEDAVMSNTVEVIASRAEFRETPVAFSTISKQDIELKLGDRDLPMMLNETPGVYATEEGGGAGEARINVRGFNQRNISVMINGVPVNDVETGWVYWSNWQGLGEVTTSQQLQRGLGAARIANPAVGGSLNIITSPAEQDRGIDFEAEYGADQYFQSNIVANTGKVGNFAASAMVIRRQGDGFAEKLFNDTWGYYLGMSWDVSKNHFIDFYLFGAPQEHGQRSWKENIPNYSHELARELGFTEDQLQETDNLERGNTFNQHWGPISDSIDMPTEYYLGQEREMRFSDGILETQNYYHKPQMNINWLWLISEKLSVTSVAYFSFGQGGGSGYYGSFPGTTEDGYRDYEGTIITNSLNNDPNYSGMGTRSVRILRNSVNNHFWVGYLGTADFNINKNWRLQFGIDYRYYKGEHYREVRSLLGGDFFVDERNGIPEDPTRESSVRRLGDKIGYHNDSFIHWTGGFFQSEYKKDDLSVFFNATASNSAYKRKDYFRFNPETGEDDWTTDVENILGYTLKAGGNYNLSSEFNVFTNFGYYSNAPLFSDVFSFDNRVYDYQNEEVLAGEIGVGYWSKSFKANINAYYTNWLNRATTINIFADGADEDLIGYVPGLDALHQGVELEVSYAPIRQLRFNVSYSIGDWLWTSNTSGIIFDNARNPIDTINVFAKDIRVGDAAQRTYALSMDIMPFRGAFIDLTYIRFMDYYSDFNPLLRQNPNDNAQPWQIPDYGVLNGYISYWLPFRMPISIQIYARGYNLLDDLFITDADDDAIVARQIVNGSYNEDPAEAELLHDATSAEVHIGRPFTWNFGINIRF